MNSTLLQMAICGQLDLKKVAMDLLDTNPDLFVELAMNQVPRPKELDCVLTIKRFIQNDQLVTAIKELRAETGLGLKEAKDVVFSVARNDPPVNQLSKELAALVMQIDRA